MFFDSVQFADLNVESRRSLADQWLSILSTRYKSVLLPDDIQPLFLRISSMIACRWIHLNRFGHVFGVNVYLETLRLLLRLSSTHSEVRCVLAVGREITFSFILDCHVVLLKSALGRRGLLGELLLQREDARGCILLMKRIISIRWLTCRYDQRSCLLGRMSYTSWNRWCLGCSDLFLRAHQLWGFIEDLLKWLNFDFFFVYAL